MKDLKVGVRVAVDTKDDASDKPHAISVKWGATSAAGKAATGRAAPKNGPQHENVSPLESSLGSESEG